MESIRQQLSAWWCAVVLTTVCFCGMGCHQSEQAPAQVRVGLVAPFTGPAAIWGQWLKEGAGLAAYQYTNAAHRCELRLIYEDSEGSPSKAVQAIQKLISLDRVQIVYGPLSSAEVLAVAPIAEKAKVVLLTPSASSKDITKAGDYIFRTYPSDQQQSVFLAKYCFSKLRAKKIAVIYRVDDFGQGVKDDFTGELQKLGAVRVLAEGFAPGVDNFRSIIAKVKISEPEFTLIVGMPKDLGLILGQAAELEWKTQFISTANIENPEVLKLAGTAAEGVIYGSVVFNTRSDDLQIRAFQELYKKQYGKAENAGLGVALAYDGMRVILNAVERAQPLSPQGIRDALYSMKDFPGVTGSVTFDKNGDVTKSFGLKIIRQGKFEVLLDKYESQP